MGLATQGFIFQDLKSEELLNSISKVQGLSIVSEDISRSRKSYGEVIVSYKGNIYFLLIIFSNNDSEYIKLFSNYTDGFNQVKSKIHNYGEEKSLITLRLGKEPDTIQLMTSILNLFGGVLIPIDSENKIQYIESLK